MPIQETVWAILNQWFHPQTRFIVAYSGGKDSHVLLHAVSQLKQNNNAILIEAWHVNHGLSPNALAWTEHCRITCEDLNIAFKSFSVSIDTASKNSLEELARNARYAEFQKNLGDNDVLLTAHTQNDQAETVLMHLSRGSGLLGLGGIPEKTVWPKGQMLRPMLDIDRQAISEYAQRHKLNWIEDESNQDTRFLRNAVRHNVLPQLKNLNSGVINNIARSAKLCAETNDLLTEYLLPELQNMLTTDNKIQLSVLMGESKLSSIKIKSLLRLWFKQNDCSLPSEKKLEEICNQMLWAKHDACPEVHWGQHTIKRYQGLLSIHPYTTKKNEMKPNTKFWSLNESLALSEGTLWTATEVLGQGMTIAVPKLEVRFRCPGARYRIWGENLSRKLKHILQELNVPPWERDITPLFFLEGCLVAVGEHIVGKQLKNIDPMVLGWVLRKEKSAN